MNDQNKNPSNLEPTKAGDFLLLPASSPGRMRLCLEESFIEKLGAPVVSLNLAPAGTHSKAGDAFGFVHTSLGAHDLRAPFAMRVLAVNGAALAEARLASESPTGRGWLVEIETH